MIRNCSHCRGGWFDPNGSGFYFGMDIACVNGVLIDIDEHNEGHCRNVVRPVAPCHPMWARQKADPDAETWENDSIARLDGKDTHP